jgi:hypothetical protein
MVSIRSRVALVGIVVVLLAGVPGCPDSESGKPTAHLQGTVTIGGQPIPANAQAHVMFSPVDMSQANSSSSIIENGRFDVPDAPMGTVKVSFDVQRPTGRMEAFAPGARPEEVYESLVPEGKASTTIEVAGDKSDLNFDL